MRDPVEDPQRRKCKGYGHFNSPEFQSNPEWCDSIALESPPMHLWSHEPDLCLKWLIRSDDDIRGPDDEVAYLEGYGDLDMIEIMHSNRMELRKK